MSKELTYILGAGASFQSIPVVKTFNKRLLKFRDYLESLSNESDLNEVEKFRFKGVIDSIKSLFHAFSSHHSFDTYFKKLFHLGDDNQINLGKRLLHLYFLWEHSSSSLNYNDIENSPEFKKQSLFDRRYDALIAGLLEPVKGKSEALCNINFISWNYDINLLESIKNFFYPKSTYKKFLSEIEKDQFVWKIGDKIRIININGNFYNSGFDDIDKLSNCDIDKIIKKKVLESFHDLVSIDMNADKIKFAWELSEMDAKSLNNHLRLVIYRTENLVIIGYTFPVYNRFIDLSYLTQEDFNQKEIIIQDPNANELKQNLLDIYKMEDANNVQAISSCESFYLPSSIFGVENYKKRFIPSATSI